MAIVITIIVLMGLLGLFFGIILAVVNRNFAVEVDPLVHLVEDILPKGQCGACGYAGCLAYAEAVVKDKKVPPDLCIPGKAEVAKKVAELTGKQAASVEVRIASVRCSNPICTAKKKYKYSGIKDCLAASIMLMGPKDCSYGCVGLGTCVRHCPFGAIKLNENGLPVVDYKKCTGCGKCESVCPKKIIKMIPAGAHVEVFCSSKDKGAIARKHCNVACLGCGICKKSCPYNAIKIENNLAIVDFRICLEKCKQSVCLEKCPTKAIRQYGVPAVLPSRKI